MRAFVVHGIHCRRPMAEAIQDVKQAGIRGIVGARWLLEGQRRANKTTSSVVIFLSIPVSFQVHDSQTSMKVRGHWLPKEAYDFERPEVTGVEVRLIIWSHLQVYYVGGIQVYVGGTSGLGRSHAGQNFETIQKKNMSLEHKPTTR